MKFLKLSAPLLSVFLWTAACNNPDKVEDSKEVEKSTDKGVTRQDNTEKEKEGNSVNFEVGTDSSGNPTGKVEGEIDLE